MGSLGQATALLAAAVVFVPLFKRAQLGAILGYLAAGLVLGPNVLGVVGDVDGMLHVSELGVVFFLFLVGLELEPKRLWSLRRTVFGLGSAQLVATGVLVLGGALLLGLPFAAAMTAGLGLALSSTAIALQLLADRGQLTSPAGRAGFGVLLFQDLAVVPLLALIPLLAGEEAASVGGALLAVAKVVGMVVAVAVGGRYVTRPIFRFIAASHVHEISTAVAILIVVGTGLLMTLVGMSMALGAFLAGVLLADSEYRHELEAAIDPFKGLLLGLFFMAVGMSIDVRIVVADPLPVLAGVAGLIAVKGLVLLAIGKAAGIELHGRVVMAAALAQGGEFAFVLFGVAADANVLDDATRAFLVVVVSASMAATPLVMLALDRALPRLLARLQPKRTDRPFDAIDDEAKPVIIAGFGRYGQIVARVLSLSKIGFTALEVSPEHVDSVRRYGNTIYYGDASRLDLLRAAKAEEAKAFVLAIDDPEASVRTATVVKKAFPRLPIYARARNRQHAFKLMDLGVSVMNRETFFSSLELARRLLVDLGLPDEMADARIARFRAHDEELLRRQYAVHHDEAKLVETSRQFTAQLNAILEEDQQEAGP
jgi:glutathione-regulated potassium-efflux system ancillary protein KefC/glutathione-regulated potassium-efflux system protein KefB